MADGVPDELDELVELDELDELELDELDVLELVELEVLELEELELDALELDEVGVLEIDVLEVVELDVLEPDVLEVVELVLVELDVLVSDRLVVELPVIEVLVAAAEVVDVSEKRLLVLVILSTLWRPLDGLTVEFMPDVLKVLVLDSLEVSVDDRLGKPVEFDRRAAEVVEEKLDRVVIPGASELATVVDERIVKLEETGYVELEYGVGDRTDCDELANVELELAASCDGTTDCVLVGSDITVWVRDESTVLELGRRGSLVGWEV